MIAMKEKIIAANSKQKNLTNLKNQKNVDNNENNFENKIIDSGNGKIEKRKEENSADDNSKKRLRYPGDDDNDNDNENSIINNILEFTSEKTNSLFLVSAFLCLLAGYMTNGLLGMICSGVLILFLYKIIPEKN